jgi:hypothetical protein
MQRSPPAPAAPGTTPPDGAERVVHPSSMRSYHLAAARGAPLGRRPTMPPPRTVNGALDPLLHAMAPGAEAQDLAAAVLPAIARWRPMFDLYLLCVYI